MNVGFIGLGNIGKPMAAHLPGKGMDVLVHDVMDAPVAELVALGARAATPVAMAEACEIIGLCVRNSDDVDDLLFAQGMLAAATEGTIIAIHSTVRKQDVLRWAAEGEPRGVAIIDAPITGGAHGAEAGELVYMVGGDAATFERCRPVFEHAAQRVVHAGPLGNGIVLKLAINSMTYAAFIAIKEATELARAGGLDPETLFDVGRMNGLVGDFNHRFIAGQAMVWEGCDEAQGRPLFEPFARLGEKDLDAAIATAEGLGLDMVNARKSRALIGDTFLKPLRF